ncbi:XrtA system polysaccharide deacetylase [Hyphococcus sp. DH-69]|uniref:XrtA system polysaccharide deacetylase n=1 Tax=Hyphococcus formosus TaxID=3143534 RepID=UPI00398B10E2
MPRAEQTNTPDNGPSAIGKFAMSIDVEDYFQVWAFSDIVTRDSWDGYKLRVGETTRRCLDLFERNDVRATFFTLGWVAERDKSLIREIVDRGHELASHGYDHTKVNQQSREEFAADIKKTKAMLEDIGGIAVRGYRAAGFSIDASTPWAHEVLIEAGYEYSSSSHPIAHDHYGDAQASQLPFFPVEGHHFIEAPVATTDLFGKRISTAGGGWYRAFPRLITDKLIQRAANRLDGPVIFYFHPWEIDPEQPRLKRASLKSKIRHYINLGAMESKLDKTLTAYPWRRIDQCLALETA